MTAMRYMHSVGSNVLSTSCRYIFADVIVDLLLLFHHSTMWTEDLVSCTSFSQQKMKW